MDFGCEGGGVGRGWGGGGGGLGDALAGFFEQASGFFAFCALGGRWC